MKDAELREQRRRQVRAEAHASFVPPEPDPVVEYGDEQEGYAAQLRPGDLLLSAGGRVDDRPYKRYHWGADGDIVTEAGRTPRQRTRGHIMLKRTGHFILRSEYPVRYRRPLAQEATR